MGRAVSVRLHGTANSAIDNIMAELDYNAVGALTDVRRFEWDDTDELYNLIAQSQYQYNARNQITSINHQDSNNNNIVSHGYLYNADGNITQYTNSIDGSVLYDYDFLGQLTGADYSNLDITDESYRYDLNGNRELVTNANGDLVVYSTGTNNELNSDGNYSYTYDAEGNRISKTNAAGTERELYEWDYRNRLESVTKQTFDSVSETWEDVQIVEYAYDYNNVLIRKVLDANGDGISDSKTIFLPENYQTAIQLDDADLSDLTDATVSHRYLWTPQNQDKLLADVTPTETLWTLTDHLGTIRDVVKNTPSVLVVPAHIIYDVYGNVLSCKDANGTDVSNPVLFGFTGKYFDSDTQLQNNVNRWYDATTGRWLSTDPIGFNGNDTNLYRYVGNKNNLLNDSLGLKEKSNNFLSGNINEWIEYWKEKGMPQEAIDFILALNSSPTVENKFLKYVVGSFCNQHNLDSPRKLNENCNTKETFGFIGKIKNKNSYALWALFSEKNTSNYFYIPKPFPRYISDNSPKDNNIDGFNIMNKIQPKSEGEYEVIAIWHTHPCGSWKSSDKDRNLYKLLSDKNIKFFVIFSKNNDMPTLTISFLDKNGEIHDEPIDLPERYKEFYGVK